MKAKIIQIGNSRGLRLPKDILEGMGQPQEVYLEATGGSVVIKPANAPRLKWAEAFEQMSKRGDDALLLKDQVPASSWDRSEWEWK